MQSRLDKTDVLRLRKLLALLIRQRKSGRKVDLQIHQVRRCLMSQE